MHPKESLAAAMDMSLLPGKAQDCIVNQISRKIKSGALRWYAKSSISLSNEFYILLFFGYVLCIGFLQLDSEKICIASYMLEINIIC